MRTLMPGPSHTRSSAPAGDNKSRWRCPGSLIRRVLPSSCGNQTVLQFLTSASGWRRYADAIRTDALSKAASALDSSREQEAEDVARQVTRGGPVNLDRPATAGTVTRLNGNAATRGPGQALRPVDRDVLSASLGASLDDVRVHHDAYANTTAHDLRARAFTLGSHIVFARGEYAPTTERGRRLLAHELTHVIQQRRLGANARIQCADAEPEDPLCEDYDPVVDPFLVERAITNLKADSAVENRLVLVQALKWIRRCAPNEEQQRLLAILRAELGVATGDAVWRESGTAFGGYRGSFPGYYGAAKSRLERLGVTEAVPYEPFAYDPRSDGPATYQSGAVAKAVAAAPKLEATDILYYYGHQYAQYQNPGAFANGIQTRFIDLRALAGRGYFGRVKLMISTSCATCCAEALDVFANLFPNAVILGYRKSAPESGDAVRNDFDRGIHTLKQPLLLDQAVDIDAIVVVWKSVVRRHHPNEHDRLPGYYRNGVVSYLEDGTWRSLPATDPANTCRKKGHAIEEAAH